MRGKFGCHDRGLCENQDLRLIIQHRHRIPLNDGTHHLSVSADGRSVSVCVGAEIHVFKTQEPVAAWRSPENVSGLSFSDDGNRLAVVNNSPNITVHDTQTGKVLSVLNRNGAPDFLRSDNQVHAVIYPGAKTLVSTGSKQRLYVSDVATGHWQHIMFMKFRGARIVVSPTGRHVVLIGNPNPSELSGQVAVFAVNHGLQPIWNKSHATEDAAAWATFQNDGEHLATGSSDGVRIWNARDGATVRHLPITNDEILIGGCFVGQSQLMVATTKELRLIDLASGAIVDRKECSDAIVELSGSRDGRTLVTRSQTAINYWTVTQTGLGGQP